MAEHAHTHEGFDVQVERTDQGTAKVSFTVSADEIDRTIERGLRNVGQRTRMKGFRPGKVPVKVLEKQFGEQVRRDAVQHFLNHAYDDACKEHGLVPAAHPRVDLEDVAIEKGQAFRHEFQVYLRPEITLGDYKGLEIEKRAIEVTDDEVTAALDDLRRQRSRPEPAGEEGLDAEGMALCRLEFSEDGREGVLLDRDNIRLSPKVAPGGIDAAAFEERLTGAKDGDVVEVPVTFPDEFPDEAARGQQGVCRITVRQAFRIVPPTDEEIRGMMEVESEEDMLRVARERIAEAKEHEEDARIETQLLDQVIEMHAFDLPPGYLQEQAEAKAAEMRQNLEEQGVEAAAAEAQVAEQMDEIRRSSERGLRAVYLLEEISKAEDLKVTKEEMTAELASIAQRNQASVEEVGKYYQQNRMFPQLALELLERKVRRFLRESADVRGAGA
jgi:trigger factor